MVLLELTINALFLTKLKILWFFCNVPKFYLILRPYNYYTLQTFFTNHPQFVKQEVVAIASKFNDSHHIQVDKVKLSKMSKIEISRYKQILAIIVFSGFFPGGFFRIFYPRPSINQL